MEFVYGFRIDRLDCYFNWCGDCALVPGGCSDIAALATIPSDGLPWLTEPHGLWSVSLFPKSRNAGIGESAAYYGPSRVSRDTDASSCLRAAARWAKVTCRTNTTAQMATAIPSIQWMDV